MANVWERTTEKALELVKASEAAFQGLTGVFKHLMQEHGELAALVKRARRCSDADERARLYAELRRRLVAHERAESAEVYRALAEHESTIRLAMAHGDQVRELESVLERLDRLKPADPEWERAMELLAQTVEQHVFDEEGDYFPRGQAALGDESAQALTERYEAAKQRELGAT
ncbi:MAG TPA: hemerythrin domain-containing protein [Polyangiaceae bacterium]|nr:hemerythrin domain-containing protein [Polyangiaceae bacterium]